MRSGQTRTSQIKMPQLKRSIRCSLIKMFLVMIIGLQLSCKDDPPAWKKHAFNTHDLTRTSVESHLPRSLFEKMYSLLSPDGGKTLTLATANGPLPSVFAPLRIYLVEKNRGILTNGHTEIVLPSGGGEVDLRDFIQSKNGSFYFVVEFMPELADVDRHVYYLSRAEERMVDGEKFGAGCHSYFEISKAFNKAMKKNGYSLNTSKGRHISALAGTFYFAAVREGKLFLASLIIKDSANVKLQCPALKRE